MLREQAYERFKERLFSRKLRPGQFVSQRTLAALVGTSEGPMREALKRLEAESLVRLVAQRGIQIAELNVEFIRNAFGLRLALESFAIRTFALTASKTECARLAARFTDVAERIRLRPTTKLLDEALAVDCDFHRTIVASLGNTLIDEFYRLNDDKIRLIRLNSRFTADRIASATAEHLAILAALAARDADGAAAAIERHLAISLRRSLGVTDPPP
ncbi:MAG: GntR family transcriptional regulator [Rhodospirillales bacterium]|nr:GntR family transcriptional regulator [Rhodospirillales bacterium]